MVNAGYLMPAAGDWLLTCAHSWWRDAGRSSMWARWRDIARRSWSRVGGMLARRSGAVGVAVLAGWHPLHTTITTIAYDPAAHRVTATVRVFEDDLERGIARRAGAPAQAPGTSDSASFVYVRATLTLTAPGGRPIPVEWCGSRTTGDLRWLCMQAIVPGTQGSGLGGLRIRDAVLTEVYDDQVNVVMADYDGRHESLLFTRGDAAKALP